MASAVKEETNKAGEKSGVFPRNTKQQNGGTGANGRDSFFSEVRSASEAGGEGGETLSETIFSSGPLQKKTYPPMQERRSVACVSHAPLLLPFSGLRKKKTQTKVQNHIGLVSHDFFSAFCIGPKQKR